MPRRGRDLERLVHAIESATNSSPDVTIVSPKRLRDKDTGRLREHDVVLTIRQAHHEILIALECRDRSGRVGVPAVEGFYSKCQRTGVQQGIIVSSSGFTSTALSKATAYGIRTLSLEEAVGFDWCQAEGFTVFHREILRMRLIFEPESAIPTHTHFFTSDGTPIDKQIIQNIGSSCLSQLDSQLKEPVGTPIYRGFIDSNPKFYVGDAQGPVSKARSLRVEMVYIVHEKLIPMEFHTYRDASEGSPLCSVASCHIDTEVLRGRFMVLQESDGGLRMVWVPDRPRLQSE